MRTTFIETLKELARKDSRIFLLTADMGYSVFETFREEFPDRFVNTGIAEQNTIGIAAGLAARGKIVFVYSIIPFVTMRCFEQVRLDLAYNKSNVKIVGVGAGLAYGPLGTSHHALEDISIMRSLPNMTVLCPGDPVETKQLVKQSYEHNGPVYIRLGKQGEPKIHDDEKIIPLGKAIKITDGDDLVLITTSTMLETGKRWVDEWKDEGISSSLVSMPTIKPFDSEFIKNLCKKNIPIITLEEHSIIGGLGSSVAEIIAESGQKINFKRLGIPDTFSHYIGNNFYQKEKFNLNKKPDLDKLF